ncbi:hypothetical protein EV680_11131 [Uruburuella suis]|uniref:Uncharacterized protein n=1 Tax=Uruburuella suis TaxID=252130 RepID=A0ABY2C312_9NEIS|nr:hypothetical protein EV680_11131 [Uruburuella suis]
MNQHLSMKAIFSLPTLAFFSSVILTYHRFFNHFSKTWRKMHFLIPV